MEKIDKISSRYLIKNNIGRNEISDNAISFLHQLEKLEVLDLKCNKITSEGVEELCKHKNFSLQLRVLDLSNKTDNLGFNTIKDDGITFLQ